MTIHKPSVARILLIDDHPAVRQGLTILLASRDHHISAEAESRAEALTIIKTKDFDMALLDLTLQDGSGLDLLPHLEAYDISALVYTMHDDPDTIARAFRLGALGYVTKQEEPDVLFDAIETVALGKRFTSPLAAQSLEEVNEEQSQEDVLSDREKQVFTMIGTGMSNPEIAAVFDISPRTIETYLARMVKKLEIENIRELRKHAISVAAQRQG